MFCRNCGKQIENGSLCEDCLSLLEEAKKEHEEFLEQTITSEQPYFEKTTPVSPVFISPTPAPSDNYISSKKGVWAVILSAFGMLIQFVMLMASAETLSLQSIGDYSVSAPPVIALIFFSVPTLIGLIFGIQSFISFFKNKKNGKKTWANLILGAIAIELSFVALIFLSVSILFSIIANYFPVVY